MLTYVLMGRRYRDPDFTRLTAAAADRYLGTSLTAWEFARAKLRGDPVYRAVLASGWLPASGVLVDVGCGPGLLLALVAQATEEAHDGHWPDGWPAPPAGLRLHGIELRPRAADLARYALGDAAEIQTADAREARLPEAVDLAAIFDVLHLIDRPSQGPLVARIAAAMRPGALLLVREADAAAGWRFRLVRLGNRITALSRGRWRRAVRLPHGGRVAGRAVSSRLRRVDRADGGGHAVRQRPARRPASHSVDDGVLRRPVGIELIPGVRSLADARLELIGERLRGLLHRRVAIHVVGHVDRRPRADAEQA